MICWPQRGVLRRKAAVDMPRIVATITRDHSPTAARNLYSCGIIATCGRIVILCAAVDGGKASHAHVLAVGKRLLRKCGVCEMYDLILELWWLGLDACFCESGGAHRIHEAYSLILWCTNSAFIVFVCFCFILFLRGDVVFFVQSTERKIEKRGVSNFRKKELPVRRIILVFPIISC